jgi:hypothetical protein
LWIMMGNSTKTSLYVSLVFCMLENISTMSGIISSDTYFSVVNLLSLYAAMKLGDNLKARRLKAP